MNRLSPEKLHLSKWTAATPVDREKHFIVTRVLRDEQDQVTQCMLEAVHSKREELIDWQELRNSSNWIQGWK